MSYILIDFWYISTNKGHCDTDRVNSLLQFLYFIYFFFFFFFVVCFRFKFIHFLPINNTDIRIVVVMLFLLVLLQLSILLLLCNYRGHIILVISTSFEFLFFFFFCLCLPFHSKCKVCTEFFESSFSAQKVRFLTLRLISARLYIPRISSLSRSMEIAH